MALNLVMRRASSSVASLAFCTVRSPVSFRSAAFSTQRLILGGNQISRGSNVSSFTFSRYSTDAVSKTSVDENLVKIIKSEIDCALEGEVIDSDEMEETPEGFSFEIIDTPGERTVLLQRKFDDEIIQVEVDTTAPYDSEEEEEEARDDEDDAEQARSIKIQIPMVVSVSKGDDVSLEFEVTAFADEIVIDSLSIKNKKSSENELAYEGPDFQDLDENLKKAFYRFLEIRGIKPSFSNFLAEYASNKDSKEYVQWLRDLKSFVEK